MTEDVSVHGGDRYILVLEKLLNRSDVCCRSPCSHARYSNTGMSDVKGFCCSGAGSAVNKAKLEKGPRCGVFGGAMDLISDGWTQTGEDLRVQGRPPQFFCVVGFVP
jgi:hypothetical protein